MVQWPSADPHCSAGSSAGGSDGLWPKSLPTYHGGHGSKHGEESLGRQGDEVSEVSSLGLRQL